MNTLAVLGKMATLLTVILLLMPGLLMVAEVGKCKQYRVTRPACIVVYSEV